VTNVIFIRHGQTVWNTERREMGQLDSPLSEKGKKQAEALAKRLQKVQFSALYSSDLGRALQTANYISKSSNKDIIKVKDLRERNMGIFQGLTKEEMAEKYPEEWEAYNSVNKFEFVIPEGESQRQRYERSISALNKLADKHPREDIVLVSHGGILMGLFEHVLGLPPGNGNRFKRRNATYNVFCRENGVWSLDTWGDTSHLSKSLV
jgi:broad specificity phosphatase PhoE